MAINPHDDYEALAKLLYPSIEASGNVYYGQTRKLTMDEVLGKNDLGFESYIDSVRVEDETADYGYTYESFWKWKLGPLSGSFEYATDKAAYVYYGKYLLNIEAVAVDNDINSGNYKTYERELSSTFVGIVTTEGYDPTFTENYDGRNFYIVKENASWYLYVAVPQSDSAGIDFDGLKLTAKGGTVTVRLDTIGWQFPPTHAVYKYLLDSGTTYGGYLPASAQESEAYKNNSTTNYDLFDNEYIGEGIQLNDGESVRFKSFRDFDFTGNTFVRFRFDSTDTGALIEASGNLKYMGKRLNGSSTYVSSDYAFTRLFRSCSLLSKAPHLPVFASLHSSRQCEYESTFQGCTSLKYPPRLPDDGIAPNRYAHMFDGCTSLKTAPELRWKNLSNRCYLSMFDGCSSLKFVKCYAIRTDALATSNWLRGVSPTGIFYKTESLEYSRNGSGIPTGWEVRILSEDSANTDDSYTTNKLITSGSNSSNNGRGDITKKSTLANMEKSFDERNEHQMNTYNADGSYNQEIWGYKSFNSPVQFRNGIYDEFVSQIAYVTHTSDNEYSVAGSSIKLNSKDPNTDKTSKLILGTIEDIGMEYNCYNGTGTCIISGDCDNTLPGISSYIPDSSAYSTVGTFCGKYTGYTYNSSYTGYIPEYIYDACRCEIASTYKDVCYSIIESETYYTDAADSEFNINKITLMEKNVHGGYSSIHMTSTPHKENHSIELKTTNVLGSGTSSLKTSKITLSSNNTYNYSYIDVSADKLYLSGDTYISGDIEITGNITCNIVNLHDKDTNEAIAKILAYREYDEDEAIDTGVLEISVKGNQGGDSGGKIDITDVDYIQIESVSGSAIIDADDYDVTVSKLAVVNSIEFKDNQANHLELKYIPATSSTVHGIDVSSGDIYAQTVHERDPKIPKWDSGMIAVPFGGFLLAKVTFPDTYLAQFYYPGDIFYVTSTSHAGDAPPYHAGRVTRINGCWAHGGCGTFPSNTYIYFDPCDISGNYPGDVDFGNNTVTYFKLVSMLKGDCIGIFIRIKNDEI